MGNTPDGHRRLSFDSYEQLTAELDRLEVAHRDGELVHNGSWSPGQVFQHVAKVIRGSYDGFTFKVSPFLALFGRVFRSFILSRGLKPGIKLPESAADFIPDSQVSFEDGLSELRGQIARIVAGEKMTQKSPVFGDLGDARWRALHLDHAAMHLGFLQTAK